MKTLTKQFGNLVVNKVGPVFTPDLTISGQGWEQTTPGGGVFVNRTYFDLAGMSMDYETLFFEGAAVQDVLSPSSITATAGNQAFVVDIMTNKPGDYWKANIRLVTLLLIIWFIVSYLFGIILVEPLNAIRIGGIGLGFWFAQQGSIFTFLVLIFVYAVRMNALDRKFDVHED